MEEGRQKKQIGAKKLLPQRFSPFSAQHFLQYKYLPLFVWTMPIRTSLASLVWVAEYYIELHLNVKYAARVERGDRTIHHFSVSKAGVWMGWWGRSRSWP